MMKLLGPRQLRTLAGLWLLASTTACAGSAQPARSAATRGSSAISRTLLDHYDLPSMPGWETRLYLVAYGPGVAAPVHHHPVEGLGYVVSGSFESAFADERPALVSAGQSFRERALVSHTLFRNPDTSRPLEFVIAFVVRRGTNVVETP